MQCFGKISLCFYKDCSSTAVVLRELLDIGLGVSLAEYRENYPLEYLE